MKLPRTKDYSRIKYYIDSMGRVWHGPFCPGDNVHYKQVESEAVGHSELPSEAVEVTPYQAAQYIKRRQDGVG